MRSIARQCHFLRLGDIPNDGAVLFHESRQGAQLSSAWNAHRFANEYQEAFAASDRVSTAHLLMRQVIDDFELPYLNWRPRCRFLS